METETLSNYEQNREKHLDNTMDVDIANNEDESVSPVNKLYEERTESTELGDKAETKETVSRRIEIESDEDCEEEEEKLLLSPARSDKAYDSDDAGDPLSPVLTRDILDSDNEAESEEKIEKNDVDKSEKVQDLPEKSEEEKKEGETETSREEQNVSETKDEPEVNECENSQEKVVNKENDDVSMAMKNISQNEEETGDKDGEKDKPAQTEEIQEITDSEVEEKQTEKTEDEENEVATKDTDLKEKDGESIVSIDDQKVTDGNNENKESTVENAANDENSNSKEIIDDKDEEGVTKEQTSLLKQTLSKPINEDAPKEPEMYEEMDMDEDFDPSLLCPELSMEVDEAPVITSNDAPAPESDGNKSPLHLYDPIFSTFVDEMTGAECDFNLTAEELELKAKTYGSKNPIQFTKIHCTACNIHLGSALDGQGNRFVHPLLKVLICKKCYHFYTSGEFEKDEDGSELYCRWCGQGGQVMCCSNCEMVFCKKCIRINFDRRKLMDIQKSDEWLCFRCNPSQLIHLRIHCAEFMEYVQSEIRRAGSSGNVDAFMNTDYCQCCVAQKKKAPDAPNAEPKTKKRKRTGEEDPDYNPILEMESAAPAIISTPSQQIATKAATVTSKVDANPVPPKPAMVRPTTALGQTTRPRVQVLTPPAVRPQNYVRLVSGGAGVRMTSPAQANASLRPPALRPIRPNVAAKHEWFEKTVRAAARVNSNLSYTLTQLNRAQANATSVEALAVVHNKLQEILSSSINSLIQIRKNLRTEFIAGIKNIRFPPKPQTTPSSSSTTPKDDDDVIFIPSDPSPPPPPLVPAKNNAPITKMNLPPSISILKKPPTPTKPVATPTKPVAAPTKPVATPTASDSKPGPSGGSAKKNTSTVPDKPKGFLRVKSFSALQSVTSECITIPDDPPEEEKSKDVEDVEDVELVKEKDPLDFSDVEPEDGTKLDSNGVTNGDDELKEIEFPTTINTLSDGELIKKLKPAQIILHRSNEIDDLVKSKFSAVNGSSSDVEVEEIDK